MFPSAPCLSCEYWRNAARLLHHVPTGPPCKIDAPLALMTPNLKLTRSRLSPVRLTQLARKMKHQPFDILVGPAAGRGEKRERGDGGRERRRDDEAGQVAGQLVRRDAQVVTASRRRQLKAAAGCCAGTATAAADRSPPRQAPRRRSQPRRRRLHPPQAADRSPRQGARRRSQLRPGRLSAAAAGDDSSGRSRPVRRDSWAQLAMRRGRHDGVRA